MGVGYTRHLHPNGRDKDEILYSECGGRGGGYGLPHLTLVRWEQLGREYGFEVKTHATCKDAQQAVAAELDAEVPIECERRPMRDGGTAQVLRISPVSVPDGEALELRRFWGGEDDFIHSKEVNSGLWIVWQGGSRFHLGGRGRTPLGALLDCAMRLGEDHKRRTVQRAQVRAALLSARVDERCQNFIGGASS